MYDTVQNNPRAIFDVLYVLCVSCCLHFSESNFCGFVVSSLRTVAATSRLFKYGYKLN